MAEERTSTPPADVAAATAPEGADKIASKAEDSSPSATTAPAPNDPATTDTTLSTSEDKATTEMNGDKVDAPADDAAAADEAPRSSKKDSKRRKSGAAVLEHKNKAIKKKQSTLHLDVEPGEYWFVRMKGYPLWPSVICDEDMLPEPLLLNRPVSAARTDGSYREDFLEGGKNARDRRYPVMFLGTNEFNWIVNTDLVPLDMDEIKAEVAKQSRGKMTIALWEAYNVAAEENTLDEFKDMLRKHQEAIVADRKEQLEKEAKKAEKEEEKKKKAARKSQGAKDEDGDEVMGGTAESAKKPKKKAEKRKLPEEEDDGSPQKGPKKIKLKTKDADVANEETKKKPEKAKKSKGSKKEEVTAASAEPEETEKEKQEKKQKSVLYLRHKLQKGFLSRDQAPKAEEMNDMNGHFIQLETTSDIDAQTIRATKINKVLKAILKLESIPKDEEYHFKERSGTLLSAWNKLLSSTGAADGEASVETPTTAEAPKASVNGTSHRNDASKSEEPQKDTAMSEHSEAPKEASTEDADVTMTDAKPAEDEAPAPSIETGEPATVST